MKPAIHPDYHTVVFHDTSADTYFKIGSTIKTERTLDLDGKTYPYVPVEVSSESHRFYTGKRKIVDKEGSTARFNHRFGRFFSKDPS